MVAIAGYAVVALLAVGVSTGLAFQVHLDARVSTALYVGDQRSAAIGHLLAVLTFPGSSLFRAVVVLPVLVWLAVRRAWWTAAWVLTAVALVGPVNTALKDLVGRVRPAFENGGARYSSLSFPSGHSSGIATLVTVLLILCWPLLTRAGRRLCLVVGVAAVVLVGFTRMWLGVHFLSDVIGGWALGVAFALTVALSFAALPGGRAALPARPAPAVAA